MALELAQDDKVQWQRFDGKLRNQIQKAEKSGFRWVNGHAELLDDFYSVFARNMRTSACRFQERVFFAMCLKLSPMILESLRCIVSRNQLPLALVRGSEILLMKRGLYQIWNRQILGFNRPSELGRGYLYHNERDWSDDY